MTNEDLRYARLTEAKRRWIEDETPRREVEHLADLYETCWTPPKPVAVDPDLLAARAWWMVAPEDASHDDEPPIRAYLAGCTRGREGAEGLVEALEAMVDEQCDYMRLNVLGDPEVQRNIKLARAALASAKRGG